MKVLQINSVCGIKSTGRIATDLYRALKENGHDCIVAYGRAAAKNIDPADAIKIGSQNEVMRHALLARLTDKAGFYSKRGTRALIQTIEAYQPDIVQLHNLHGYYINIEQLFRYLSGANLPVVWTLHDCWAFTGHCAYYDYAACTAWKTACHDCPQKKEYPTSLFSDRSRSNYQKKKELFNLVDRLTLVAISDWIAYQAKASFLKHKKIVTIRNGIDLNRFHPTPSDFKKRHQIQDKKMLLGVASVWDRRKGFDTFLELSKRLSDEEILVMVGLTDEQIRALPGNIIGIKKTDSEAELAEIYTAADVFVNPTMEEGLGLVNLEAQACGTPVITYDTGGSPECVSEQSGLVVPKKDIDALLSGIRTMDFSEENILAHAGGFDKKKKYQEYMDVYKDCLR